MEQQRHPFVDRQNEGIEVSARRMNLLDMRGLLPQKVGGKQWPHERRGHWRTQISVNGTGALHLMLILSIFLDFLDYPLTGKIRWYVLSGDCSQKLMERKNWK